MIDTIELMNDIEPKVCQVVFFDYFYEYRISIIPSRPFPIKSINVIQPKNTYENISS